VGVIGEDEAVEVVVGTEVVVGGVGVGEGAGTGITPHRIWWSRAMSIASIEEVGWPGRDAKPLAKATRKSLWYSPSFSMNWGFQ